MAHPRTTTIRARVEPELHDSFTVAAAISGRSVSAVLRELIEGFVLDTCGTFLAHMIAGLTIRQDILFFGISTAKTIDDHCGFAFPWDPFQHLFGNNADYHDIHREFRHLKEYL